MTPLTYRNTVFHVWLAKARAEFARHGMPEPSLHVARDAYDVGETPQSWADYVRNT